ncbi:hypothetical protein EES43_27785 [Streptomyces sp. ADI96-02]|uniref:hypothetical protein n=1 Tax=Streptomyces sp. ADI96-02 TaxID=1522760 RepID=UPI000FBD3EA8|nr:hypothetical protein [Streptomyces sp. ADI96-02]RPK54871.1 hypothetical protein EES43_27785 [Streptomyces sp. ADI96-02]
MTDSTHTEARPSPRTGARAMMSRNRARGAAVLVALVTTGAGLIAMPSAQAADTRPSDAELLSKCDNGTKFCVFHPSGSMEKVAGPTRKVGDEDYNCTSLTQRSSIGWSDTTEESNSLGLSMTVGLGWEGVFSTSITTSYEHTWRHATTESSTTSVDVRPGQVGWVTRTPDMQKVKGTYELIFKDRFHGKRYWYVPFEATGPLGTSSMAQRTRPMTDEEKANHC